MTTESNVRIMEVVPHNLKWKEDYLMEAEIIQNIMKDMLIRIHHIGSTAIPGIYAKPIIDILVEVKDITRIDEYNEEMEKVGYIARGEWGIVGRRYFIKGLYERTHHVHIYQYGNPEVERHLRFRDYMIAHTDEAMRYEELKRDLAEKYRYDPAEYIDGKDAFVKEMDRKAEEWAKYKGE